MSRKRIIGISATAAVVAGLLAGGSFLWVEAPYFKARLLLSTFDYHSGRKNDALGPSMCGLEYWNFSLNTYTDGIDTWCVKSLYNDICGRLQTAFGAQALSTYLYKDKEGWQRQVTIVRLREGESSESYIAVEALENNDNNMVRFKHTQGTFDAGYKDKVNSWALTPIFPW